MYLTSNFKGKYRIRAPYEQNTNQFPKTLKGTNEEIDCYIDCRNNIQIFYYGKGWLQAYIPTVQRGKNILKAIDEDGLKDKIKDVEITDGEVLFMFKGSDMELFEKYLHPKTNGANISPFSTKNLPKNKEFKIPDDNLNEYKEIINIVPKAHTLDVFHITNNFISSLANRKRKYEDIKNDMAMKMLKGKDYIYSIGKWEDYLKYLKKELDKKNYNEV